MMGADEGLSRDAGGAYHDLLALLEERKVDYCLLKGTNRLSTTLEGNGDLDLLVDPMHLAKMAAVLLALGFKPSRSLLKVPAPAQWHYFRPGVSGAWDHVHLHSSVLCSEQLRASHVLASMTPVYLAHSEYRDGIRLPRPAAEYAHLLLKVYNRFASLPDLALLAMGRWEPWPEIAAVRAGADVQEAAAVIHEAGLDLSPRLLSSCDAALARGRLTARAVSLGLAVRRRLGALRVGSRPDRLLDYSRVLKHRIRRLWDGGKGRASRYGGLVAAVVGPDAVGKSTLVAALSDRFAEVYRVKVYHGGKPGPTVKTLPFRVARRISRLARRASPSHGGSSVGPERLSLRHAINAWALAIDRRATLLEAQRQAALGALVVFDRYPSQVPGGMDGPRLAALSGAPGLRGWLSVREAAIYAGFTPPDLVLRLTAPVSELLARDGHRRQPDGDEYLRQRAAPDAGWDMVRQYRQVEIDSSSGPEAVRERALAEIWSIF